MIRKIDDPRLSILVVWQPMSGGTADAVPKAMKRVDDPRARHFWDPSGATMRVFKKTFATPREAWDVYALYAPGVRWAAGDAPPKPTYLMHQLRGVGDDPWDGADYLVPERFRSEASALLVPSGSAPGQTSRRTASSTAAASAPSPL